ncbi:MAG: C/D box methylation guide ribonucleoprotein complex aNOP56 subunit [Candidatus Altiarchaeota archaeon]|nr:C/D box methylation guide ribonucleoprotein complex aNOP56 subunit [Candidatus Altiarchaeota archaeon]
MIEVNTNILGSFALKGGRIIKKILFPKDTIKLAEKLMEIENAVCDEEKELISYLLETGTKSIKLRDPDRFSMYRGDMDLLEDKTPTSLLDIASELGIPEKDVTKLLDSVNLEITKVRMREISRDQLIMQAVASIDELEESINTLIKRLREWYSLNFPELDFLVKKHDLYAKLVSSDLRDADEGLRKSIEEARKQTLGVDFSEEDKKSVKYLSDSILGLYMAEQNIESYIEEAMGGIAPNMAALAGPILSARIISLAGGLERLAKLPASTIQVLGAEDSFFRFLRTGERPPKHGVIFQLPEIRSAPKKVRGKVSRIFAAKMAIAARTDFFRGEFIGDKLRGDFLGKLEKLK